MQEVLSTGATRSSVVLKTGLQVDLRVVAAESFGAALVYLTGSKAHPERLDLLDTQNQMAKDEGVLVAIGSDSHSTFEFKNLRFGVGQARRSWLGRGDVLNARPLAELRPLLKRTM